MAKITDDDALVERARAATRVAPDRREARGTLAVAVAFALAVARRRRARARGRAATAPSRRPCSSSATPSPPGCGSRWARASPSRRSSSSCRCCSWRRRPPCRSWSSLGFALSTLPEHLRGDRHPRRLGTHVVSAAYAVGPVLVLWAAGRPEIALVPRTFAILAAALVAQFALDVAGWAALGHSPRGQARALAAAWQVDAALTPLGLAIAVAGHGRPFAVVLGLPLVWLLAEFARQRSQSVDQALELSEAYRGTGPAARRRGRGRRRLHRPAQPGRRLARAGRLRRARRRRRRPPQGRADRAPARRRQGRDPEGDHPQARPAGRRGAGADRDAHGDRAAHAEAGRRAPGGRRRARALVPRALGRPRLSRPARGRGASRSSPGSSAPATHGAR